MQPSISPCPFLPTITHTLTAACFVRIGHERGPLFYETALHYAQSLWCEGFPARALLLLNRAMGCALDGTELIVQKFPMPYRAVAWFLVEHREGQFIGNPRRHWQHLATRMSGPRCLIRTWRAWACWALAVKLMPDQPADQEQIVREGIREPTRTEIFAYLAEFGLPGEAEEWLAVLEN